LVLVVSLSLVLHQFNNRLLLESAFVLPWISFSPFSPNYKPDCLPQYKSNNDCDPEGDTGVNLYVI
jgi:hypothetical protein